MKMPLLVASLALATLNTPAMAANALKCIFPGGSAFLFELTPDANGLVGVTYIMPDVAGAVPLGRAKMTQTLGAYNFDLWSKDWGRHYVLNIDRTTGAFTAVGSMLDEKGNPVVNDPPAQGTCQPVTVAPKL